MIHARRNLNIQFSGWNSYLGSSITSLEAQYARIHQSLQDSKPNCEELKLSLPLTLSSRQEQERWADEVL